MINYRVMHRLLDRSRIFFIGKKDQDPVDQVYIHILSRFKKRERTYFITFKSLGKTIVILF